MRLLLVIPPCGSIAHEQRIPLRNAPVDVGGASDCAAIVDHPSVGTARVRLERRGEDWVAVDRDGRGMCSVGGVPLRARAPRIVRPPHVLRLGDVDLELQLDLTNDSDVDTREIALRAAAFAVEVAPAHPRVRVVEGPRIGEILELCQGRIYRVGRARSCDLFLDEEDASREQLSLELSGSRVVVRDLGSARGTFLGPTRLEPRRGAIWDPRRLLQAGGTVFALELPDFGADGWLARLGRIDTEEQGHAPDPSTRQQSQALSAPLDDLPSEAGPLVGNAVDGGFPMARMPVDGAPGKGKEEHASRDPWMLLVAFVVVLGVLSAVALLVILFS